MNRRTLILGASALGVAAFAGGAFVLKQRRDAPRIRPSWSVTTPLASAPPMPPSHWLNSSIPPARPAVHTTPWCRKSGGSSRRRSGWCCATPFSMKARTRQCASSRLRGCKTSSSRCWMRCWNSNQAGLSMARPRWMSPGRLPGLQASILKRPRRTSSSRASLVS